MEPDKIEDQVVEALRNNDCAAAGKLLREGASLAEVLLKVSGDDNGELGKRLVDALATNMQGDLDTPENGGQTPLQLARDLNHTETVELLSRFTGKTPLDYAREQGHPEIIKMLEDAATKNRGRPAPEKFDV